MLRWTLTIATVLLVGVWLASGRWLAGWSSAVGKGGGQTSVWLTSGGVNVVHLSGGLGTAGPSGVHFVERTAQPPTMPGYWLEWLPSRRTYGSRVYTAFCPLWIPALLPLGGSLAAWRGHARRRRLERGGCAACGYDLRGLRADEEGGKPICPECGRGTNGNWQIPN